MEDRGRSWLTCLAVWVTAEEKERKRWTESRKRGCGKRDTVKAS